MNITCSIIILTKNLRILLGQCIDAIIKHTKDVDYELIIVDNASTDTTYEYLQSLKLKNLKIIKNNTNLSFSIANNKAAILAKGKYLCFLNNDTIPQAQWLSEMIKVYESRQNCGIAGSKIIALDETIQHAGVVIDKNVHPIGFYYGFPKDHPLVNRCKEFAAVTGACLLIKKEIFLIVQGFDENYYFNLEDIDLCLKVRQAGYKVFYCPTSVIYHYQGGTEKYHEADKNKSYFFKKWQNVAVSDAEQIAQEDGIDFKYEYWRYFVMFPDGLFDKKDTKYFIPLNVKSNLSNQGQPAEQLPYSEPAMDKKRLLIISYSPLLKKRTSIILKNIYNTNILQDKFEIHQLCWGLDKDEKFNNVYLRPEISENDDDCLMRLEQLLIVIKPQVILLLEEPIYFRTYLYVLNMWQGNVIGWFPIPYEIKGDEHVIKRPDFILTFSNFGKECILKKSENKKIKTLMAGVDKNVFKPLNKDNIEFFRFQLRIPQDAIVFLAVGENIKKEAILLTLEAFKVFSEKYKNKVDKAILYLITPMNNTLINFIDSDPVLKGKVFYSGSYVSTKEEVFIKFYQLSDIFISLSRGNGIGMSIREAQSCGLPVIASNYSVNSEIVNTEETLLKGVFDIESWDAGYIKYFVPDIKNAVSVMYSLYKDVTNNKKFHPATIDNWEDITLKLKQYLEEYSNAVDEKLKFNYPEPTVICAL